MLRFPPCFFTLCPGHRQQPLCWISSVAVMGLLLALAVPSSVAASPSTSRRVEQAVADTASTNPTAATPVYRCGQTYQQQPCSGSKALDLPPEPSEGEVKAAQEIAHRERSWGESMEKDRLARERVEREALARQQRAAAARARAASAAEAATSTTSLLPRQHNKRCSKSSSTSRTRSAGTVSSSQFERDTRQAACEGHVSYLSLPPKNAAKSSRAGSGSNTGKKSSTKSSNASQRNPVASTDRSAEGSPAP
jgi:hypothetical protein